VTAGTLARMSQLPLPISPADALAHIIEPALRLLPPALTSDESRLLVLANCLQESGLRTRVQDAGGPARGLAQFERGGAVVGVLQHPATYDLARALCAVRGVPATSYSVYTSLAGDDLLAAGFARLLLYTDPAPLPPLGAADAAWAYYKRNWRPGKPRPADWPDNYATALACVRGE
jgi:hypothetical protein